jgi:D-arabinose 5-phosphate isomerase GutQ
MQVFISYSRKDREKAIQLHDALNAKGITPWIDLSKIPGGADWEIAISKAIEQSDYFLALFSKDAMNKKGYFHKEIKIALEHMKKLPPRDVFIIPVRLDECEISYYELQSINHIDLFPSYDEGFDNILSALKSKDAKPVINAVLKERKSTEYDEFISFARHYKHPKAGGSSKKKDSDKIPLKIEQRTEAFRESFKKTVEGSEEEIKEVIEYFRDWMLNGTIVRVVGAGRARLAAAIPANRLAHGGARVYIQDELIPMPHTIKGGGIIAVSASGETPSTIEILEKIKKEKKDKRIIIIGIANKTAEKFQKLCSPLFIGIDNSTNLDNPLQALADTEEYVISMLLDAMVVAAGKLAGYDDAKWRLGHEDLGASGPWHFTSKFDYKDIKKRAKALDLKYDNIMNIY